MGMLGKLLAFSFFHSCTDWLVSHSHRMEPLMTVSGSLSEPSLAQSLFLWPVKTETVHRDSKEYLCRLSLICPWSSVCVFVISQLQMTLCAIL